MGANLSSPQLGGWLFGSGLSVPLRERIVHRLLDYPGSLQDQVLLDYAVRCLAKPTWSHRVAYALLEPLGWMQNVFFRQIEYCAILREMRIYADPPAPKMEHKLMPAADGASDRLDWTQLADKAEASDRAHADGAVYSATNALLPEKRRAEHIRVQAVGSRDAEFDAKVVRSKEFDDLQLLIDVLKELHVDAVFVSQPFNGIYRNLGGVSPRARQVYYDKLAGILARSGFPLLDFSDHEQDRFFFNDAGHPSAKAWIYYNRGLDQFYHRTQG